MNDVTTLAKQMDPVSLKSQLGGRIRNIGRPKLWYMAVAEAVQNAMDAIEQSGAVGKIEIELRRGTQLLNELSETAPIEHVIVRDTGIGFDDLNFDSFCTPDTLLKQKRGGKGIGRLVCLQVFERIQGRSVFQNGQSQKVREFVFQRETPEMQHLVTPIESAQRATEVGLMNLRIEYQSTAAVSLDKFSEWLSEHFLPALVEKPSWLSSIVVVDREKKVDLTAKISTSALWNETFSVKGFEFQTACYELHHDDDCDHVRLVACGRIVDSNTRPLEHYIPHLNNVGDEKGHVVLVRSPFFDSNVNDARNGVSFFEDGEELALMGVTAAQFREGLGDAMRRRLGSRLAKSDHELRTRIEELVRKEAPYYRYLLDGYLESKDFTQLSVGVRDEEVLASLDAYRRRDAISLRKESRRLARLQAESADYQEGARKLAAQIENQKKVALAEYVSLRKIVLDRLEQLLTVNAEGVAHREDTIHNLIFPQKTSSEDPSGIEHQLWILDERLESHAYLASDDPIDGLHGDRPDLLVALNRPCVFGSDPSPKAKGYDRLALVEFKRALKDLATVPTDELPHRQMMRYAHEIMTGAAVHSRSRRPIDTTTDVRFYLYAVCEVSKGLLERLVRDEGFTRSPAGDGAFAVKNEGRYCLEYISLPKLLEDAKARNAAFFRRLGLEP